MAETRHDVVVERDVGMAMRDGVVLRSDIYRPKGGGPYPVLLIRSPYDKSTSEFFSLMHPEWYARQGLIVVTQDVRGCFASEGRFRPFHNETADGVDTIAACAALPGSNGKVGMYGFSYPGLVQLLAATERPAALGAIAPSFTCDGAYEGWTYRGGALQLAFVQSWAAALALPEVFRRGRAEDARPAIKLMNGIAAEYDHLPLTDHPSLWPAFAPFYYEWLAHPTFDAYWQGIDISLRYDRIAVPALHLGGWYDIFVEGTIRNFAGLSQRAGTAEARRAQKLVIGPWYHQPWSRVTGDLDFGEEAADRTDEIVVRWYKRWLAGERNGIDEEPAASVFVMGENRWRHAATFPFPGTKAIEFHLHSGGRANQVDGDGRLDPAVPGGEPYDIFACDPGYPVPSSGGRSCCPAELAPMGPRCQLGIEARPDVLVYTGPALAKDLTVIGPVDAVLYAASTADDTDFTVKLVDVHPDGRAINLVDGILRTSFRDGAENPTPIEPDRVYRYAFRVGHTANTFKAGHRVRVEISSTNFPMYERTLNHFRRAHDGGYHAMRTATQRLFHDAERPSHVVLPVVP